MQNLRFFIYLFIFCTNRISGKPSLILWISLEMNAHIFIDYLVPPPPTPVPLQNTKRPQTDQFTTYYYFYYYISLSIRKLFCLPVQTSRQHRTAITIITRSAAADPVILWHGKKGIRSVRGNWWRTVSFLARRFLFLMHNVMA